MLSNNYIFRYTAFVLDFIIIGFIWLFIHGELQFYIYNIYGEVFLLYFKKSVLEWLFLLVGVTIYAILFSIYSLFFLGRFGATIGKMVFGLKVVDEDGKPITYKLAAKRTLLLLLLGGIWFIFGDNKEESPYDKKLNLYVVRRPIFKK